MWLLHEQKESCIWQHFPWHPRACTRAKEACSGLGSLGFGASRVGIQITVRNEIQDPTACVLELQGTTSVVRGDIAENSTVKAMHLTDDQPGGLMAGFSCQPYSLLGDREGGQDNQASSLTGTGTLKAACLLNASFLLLECVQPASEDPFARGSLEAFQVLTGFKAIETTLDLQDVWCARRKRWWCLLIPTQIPLDHIPTWPQLPGFRTVGEVLPQPCASAAELEALLLTDDELRAFQQRKPVSK